MSGKSLPTILRTFPNTSLLSVSMLAWLWTFHTSGIIRCVACCVYSFTPHIIFKGHPCRSMCCYILFIYLFQMSTDGHLGCFHVWLLWVMLVQPSLYRFLCRHMFSILLGIYLGRTLAGHWVTPCFKFLMKYQSAFHTSCITSTPASNVQALWFLHILINGCYSGFLKLLLL